MQVSSYRSGQGKSVRSGQAGQVSSDRIHQIWLDQVWSDRSGYVMLVRLGQISQNAQIRSGDRLGWSGQGSSFQVWSGQGSQNGKIMSGLVSSVSSIRSDQVTQIGQLNSG